MTAAGYQGKVGERCDGMLAGLKLSTSGNLQNARRVRVVVDHEALGVLTSSPDARKQLMSMAPNAELSYDIDIAICQAKAACPPQQLTPSKLRSAHDDIERALGVKRGLWSAHPKALHLNSDQLYELAYESFWLINKVHQCVNEASQADGRQLAARIGGALRQLMYAHNRAHAKYPDAFFVAAAQALAFTFVRPMSLPSKELEKQANYMKAIWSVLLWARAASSHRNEDLPEVSVLLTSDSCLIGVQNAHELIKHTSMQAELSHDILQLYLCCLQLQMPLACTSNEHLKLEIAAHQLQAMVDDAVAQSRIAKDVDAQAAMTLDCQPYTHLAL